VHILFLNPQGNFDPEDSHLTEHPDFGGQLIYVKELALAMAARGHRIDIVTRRIEDPEWPEFAAEFDAYPGFEENPRIIRLPCGGPRFLAKEQLWDHLEEWVGNIVAFYGAELPDFATAHYADGGYAAALLEQKTGIGFSFTGHSLGAQKLDKLGTNAGNWPEMERRFRFSRRIAAERIAMGRSRRIITSTNQERQEQYSHPLYKGAVDISDRKFAVIPPGVNTRVFTTESSPDDKDLREKLRARLGDDGGPFILVSSRLDEKKNIIGVVEAYAGDPVLQDDAELIICLRGIDDPFAEIGSLPDTEQQVLGPILAVVEGAGIKPKVHFLDLRSQRELAGTYRILAEKGSVFALSAFYEPFGLAPIEAAACGLVCVATMNGGPSEIFEDGSGVLVDPFDSSDIARGLRDALERQPDLSVQGRQRVLSKYTWNGTAEAYLNVIAGAVSRSESSADRVPMLDAIALIEDYLSNR
jgi:sucrose-phosphate synthase